MLPAEVEEYLCFNVNPNYNYIRLHFVSFDAGNNTLTANYIYTAEVDDIINKLKPELEKLFIQAVALPIKYKFVYSKSYIDETILRLAVFNYLKNAFAVMSGGMSDGSIVIETAPNGYNVNLYLTQQFADFLSGSKSFANFKKDLHEQYFCEFNFYFNIIPQNETTDDETDDSNYVPAETVSNRVDKVFHIKNQVYLLGWPIKEKPLKIEFLRVCDDLQIVAGEIARLTKREYTRQSGEKKGYWTFTLNDGDSAVNCVFFPNKKNISLFERLTDEMFVVVMGTYSEKNGRKSLNISGIATAEKK
jgi:hypothetical protein